jgi:hypothetical protein
MFNPTAQGETFDPKGDYVLRWCPELAKLSDEWIHQPVAALPGWGWAVIISSRWSIMLPPAQPRCRFLPESNQRQPEET